MAVDKWTLLCSIFVLLVSTIGDVDAQGCGPSVFTEPSGIITSPNYPEDYNDYDNCSYAIQASQTSSFYLTFQVFHLELSPDCMYDWVQIQCSDGTTVTPKYCGQTDPPPIVITNCNEVRMRFQSDETANYQGFSLQYTVTANAYTTQPTTKSSIADCGPGVFTEPSGIITSPDYPEDYSNNASCTYAIQAPQTSSFYLTFQVFHLEISPDCMFDWVQIQCSDGTTVTPKYCGEADPPPIVIPNCNEVWMKFQSDETSNYEGFSLQYTVTANAYTTQPTTKGPIPECGTTVYTEPTGNITSPNYPEDYNNNASCYYRIQAQQPSSFYMTFHTFHLELSADCAYDWVQIQCSDGTTVTPKYCGQTDPPPIVIPNCNEVWMKFQSDEAAAYEGFSLQYTVTANAYTTQPTTKGPIPECGTTVYTEPSGIITSPNYPEDYNNNASCSYVIQAPQTSSFYMTFQTFHLEISADCAYDWVQIQCSDGTTVTPRYCGQTDPPPIVITNCNEVWMKFQSDEAAAYEGFSLQYTVTANAYTTHPTTTAAPGCGTTVFTEPSGTVTSPNYPRDYNNNDNCTYAIQASQTSSFVMIFQAFDLEGPSGNCDYDWVQIGCSDGSTVTPKHCGSTRPPPFVIDTCKEVFVRFHSDDALVYGGFSLQYSVTPDANSESPATKISTTGCGNTPYTEPSGNISSPNYPESYNANENCTYAIWASQSSSIAITFQAFHLESSSDCRFDWVQIGCKDGSYVTPKHCGTTIPPPVIINSCSEVLIWFHSDDSQSFTGFSLLYLDTSYEPTTKVSTTSLPTTTMSITSTTASTTMPTTMVSATNSTIKTPTTTRPTTTTTATSTISTTATFVTTGNLTAGICQPSDDVPLIVVSTLLMISSLGYIVLIALFMIQRYRQRTSKDDAKAAEVARTEKGYVTIHPASGIPFENA